MTDQRGKLQQLEQTLADETLYLDADRKPELTSLLKTQAEHQSRLEQLELAWLEASQALEEQTVE